MSYNIATDSRYDVCLQYSHVKRIDHLLLDTFVMEILRQFGIAANELCLGLCCHQDMLSFLFLD